MRKFFKTTYTVVVLSEDAPATGQNLEGINYEITDGHCSGVVTDDGGIELSAKQMAAELNAQGSAPEFFLLDGEGNKLEEET